MMSGANNLSSKCGTCHRWVTNGLICTGCCNCFQPQCTRQVHAMVLYPIKYQKHVKQWEVRMRNLERKLKAAKEKICKLKRGNVSSNFM
jgi:hypothetical protein